MSRVKHALVFSLLAQQSNLLISFFSIAIVARLLTPSEIGVFSVASVMVMIATEIRSFGVNQYLIREEKLTCEKKSTALGVSIISCWGLAFSAILLAPSLGRFYEQPDLAVILNILSLTFFMGPFASVPFAMFSRELRFDLIFRIKLFSSFIRAFATISLVLLGYSYFGLAWGVLIGSTAELIAIYYVNGAQNLYRPTLKDWRNVLSFGMVTSSASLLTSASQSLPDLILGKMNSMNDVGIFSRGMGLILFLNKIVSMAIKPIILPHLSGINREKKNVGEEYLRCIVLHGAISIPAFAVISVLALPLIRVFFGDQWDSAAPIASALSIWAIFRTIHGFLPDALIATGNEQVLLKKELISVVIHFILIVYGAQFGLVFVGFAIAIAGFFDFLVSSIIIYRFLNLPAKKVINALTPNGLIGAICFLSCFMLSKLFDDEYESWKIILFTTLCIFPTWIFCLRVFKHELWFFILQIFDLICKRLAKHSAS